MNQGLQGTSGHGPSADVKRRLYLDVMAFVIFGHSSLEVQKYVAGSRTTSHGVRTTELELDVLDKRFVRFCILTLLALIAIAAAAAVAYAFLGWGIIVQTLIGGGAGAFTIRIPCLRVMGTPLFGASARGRPPTTSPGEEWCSGRTKALARFWYLGGLILPRRTRLKVYEPSLEELKADVAERVLYFVTHDLGKRSEAWLFCCIYAKSILLLVGCLGVALLNPIQKPLESAAKLYWLVRRGPSDE